MQGSVIKKTKRLLTSFIKRPDYLNRYLNHNLIRRATPLDLELPWFPYAAIDFLEEYLRPDMTVCEYGSGGSTVFFSKRVKFVHAIEDNPYWCSKVQNALVQKQIQNVSLNLHPFNFKDPQNFEKSSYFNSIPNFAFDVIVIDGTEEWNSVRPLQYFYLESKIKNGGLILVDDSWRYPEIKNKSKAKRIHTFESTGPGRPGVTTTSAFFF
jgi:hypothetical protein